MKEEKTSAHKQCMAIYWTWHTNNRGFKPKVDASDGEGMKKMINYLFSLTPTTKEVVDTFQYILNHWDELDDFYKRGTRLRQINSNIHNIIDFFKNGQTAKNKTGVSSSYLQKLANDLSTESD